MNYSRGRSRRIARPIRSLRRYGSYVAFRYNSDCGAATRSYFLFSVSRGRSCARIGRIVGNLILLRAVFLVRGIGHGASGRGARVRVFEDIRMQSGNVVQSEDGNYRARKRSRNLRVRDIGEYRFAAVREAGKRCVESGLRLSSRSIGFDQEPVIGCRNIFKPVAGQIIFHSLELSGRGTELLDELSYAQRRTVERVAGSEHPL